MLVRGLVSGIGLDGGFCRHLGLVEDERKCSNQNSVFGKQQVAHIQALSEVHVAQGVKIKTRCLAGAAVNQSILDEAERNGVVKYTLMCVERTTRKARADTLEVVVGDAHVANIVEICRGTCTLLRFDDLVEESTIHSSRWDVRRVTTVKPQLVDEVARSLVLLLQDRRIAWKAIRADEIGVDGTGVIGADGNVVPGRLLSRSEVLEGPLDVDVALGPADDGHLLASNARNVVDCVSSILSIGLSIVQKSVEGYLTMVDGVLRCLEVDVAHAVFASSQAIDETKEIIDSICGLAAWMLDSWEIADAAAPCLSSDNFAGSNFRQSVIDISHDITEKVVYAIAVVVGEGTGSAGAGLAKAEPIVMLKKISKRGKDM
ncbi:alpha/beta-hydrolase, partial [Aureobasidium melanogenum]